MDEASFERLASAYGADIARWPAERRQEARDFLERSSVAPAILARHRALDGLLDLAAPVAASAALRQRVLAIPAAQPPILIWFSRRARFQLALFALMAFAGAWAGTGSVNGMFASEGSLDQMLIISAFDSTN